MDLNGLSFSCPNDVVWPFCKHLNSGRCSQEFNIKAARASTWQLKSKNHHSFIISFYSLQRFDNTQLYNETSHLNQLTFYITCWKPSTCAPSYQLLKTPTNFLVVWPHPPTIYRSYSFKYVPSFKVDLMFSMMPSLFQLFLVKLLHYANFKTRNMFHIYGLTERERCFGGYGQLQGTP